jgi:threonine/homoserine/homoserine lactone efflux protein
MGGVRHPRRAMPLDPALFVAFLVAAWVLILVPGPDMLFLLGQTLAGGPRRGMAAMAGIVTGAMIHIAAATAGIAALVAASPLLFAGLQALGAAYLLWLGIGALRAAWRGEAGPAAPDAAAAGAVRTAYRKGLLTNLTNPKVALFFLAFLPQFVAPDRAAPPWLQMLLMGPLVPLMAAGAYAPLILGAGRLRRWLAADGGGARRAMRWLEGIAGGLFLALGLRLAVQVAAR